MNTIEYNADSRHITDQELNETLIKHGIDNTYIKLCFLSARHCYYTDEWHVVLCVMINGSSHVMMYNATDKELIKAYKTTREGYLRLFNIVMTNCVDYILSRYMGPFEFIPWLLKMG